MQFHAHVRSGPQKEGRKEESGERFPSLHAQNIMEKRSKSLNLYSVSNPHHVNQLTKKRKTPAQNFCRKSFSNSVNICVSFEVRPSKLEHLVPAELD